MHLTKLHPRAFVWAVAAALAAAATASVPDLETVIAGAEAAKERILSAQVMANVTVQREGAPSEPDPYTTLVGADGEIRFTWAYSKGRIYYGGPSWVKAWDGKAWRLRGGSGAELTTRFTPSFNGVVTVDEDPWLAGYRMRYERQAPWLADYLRANPPRVKAGQDGAIDLVWESKQDGTSDTRTVTVDPDRGFLITSMKREGEFPGRAGAGPVKHSMQTIVHEAVKVGEAWIPIHVVTTQSRSRVEWLMTDIRQVVPDELFAVFQPGDWVGDGNAKTYRVADDGALIEVVAPPAQGVPLEETSYRSYYMFSAVLFVVVLAYAVYRKRSAL